MIEFLLLDLDDTILDFHKAEDVAVRKALAGAGVAVTDEVVALYSRINKEHWEKLERGELTREQVKVYRFSSLFDKLGCHADAKKCAANYEKLLGIGHYFLPGAKEALLRLQGEYRLFLVSNGTSSVQHSRLTSAQLYPLFEKIFISEEIGADKPSAAFFDSCFSQIHGFDREKAMIVGDSMTSDMLGGINAGIRTCWVGKGTPRYPVDYQIESLQQVDAVLDAENNKEKDI